MRTESRRGSASRGLLGSAVLLVVAALLGCSADGLTEPTSTAATQRASAPGLPSFDALHTALVLARQQANGGFNLDMWGSVVDRSGNVVAVTFTGAGSGDQWLGSRVISAQKANTANAFSLPGLALSSANLYWPTQPGNSLFGLQESNPVNPAVAYGGKAEDYGTTKDPMVGQKIGGINVFGGGVALYNADGVLVGGLGVSGDASCADHNIAWKVRHLLALDYVPGGVSSTGDDNIIYDIAGGTSPSGFGHPTCSAAATAIGNALPVTNPVRRR